MTSQAIVAIITTTVATQEQAQAMARTLVGERLVACAQIEGPLESVYQWEGTLECSSEWRLVLKTTIEREPQLRQRVFELHPYQVPQWLVVATQPQATAYEKWVQQTDPSWSSDQALIDSALSRPFHVQLFGPAGEELGGDAQELHRFLSRQAQVYLEGDGSFGWTGPGWSVYGMLYDRSDKVQYAELQGRCPLAVWNVLIAKLTTMTMAVQVTELPSGRLYGLQDFELATWPATV